jgi:squalene-hopene/tetraprenyl-beta-curcumene cyclase
MAWKQSYGNRLSPQTAKERPAMARSFASPIGLLVIVLALGASILVKLAPVGAEATAGGNAPNLQEEARTPTEVVRLFNGKDLSNWETWLRKTGRQDPQRVFRVTDGLLHITGEDHGYIATPQSWKDYHLVVEFKWGKETFGSKYVRNSGILLHARGPHGNAGGVWMASIECQLAQGCVGDLIAISGKDEHGKPLPVEFTSEVILGPDKRPRWKPGGEKRTFTRGQLWWNQHDPEFKELIDTRGRFDVESPLGEWTRVECICRGDTITIRVNGHTVNHCFQAKPSAGRILLQSEGFEMFFRRVELRPLEKNSKGDFGANRADEPLAGRLSLEQAAAFLDNVSLQWTQQRQCGTCHTNYPYLLARPHVRVGSRDAEEQVRRFFEQRVANWDSPEPERKPRWDTEVVATAAFLAMHDALTTGKLHPLTRQALDRMWTLQKPEGHWNWLKCDWPPAEHDDYYGVIVALIGVGMAPENYRDTPQAQAGIARAKQWLAKNPPASLHHRGMLLWASAYFPELLSPAEKQQIIADLKSAQNADGGWALPKLGEWLARGKRRIPLEGPSDGYATGFVVYVLRQAGVSREDAAIQRGLAWLRSNQRESGRWFTRSLNTDNYHFVTHMGTCFAVLAITSCQ